MCAEISRTFFKKEEIFSLIQKAGTVAQRAQDSHRSLLCENVSGSCPTALAPAHVCRRGAVPWTLCRGLSSTPPSDLGCTQSFLLSLQKGHIWGPGEEGHSGKFRKDSDASHVAPGGRVCLSAPRVVSGQQCLLPVPFLARRGSRRVSAFCSRLAPCFVFMSHTLVTNTQCLTLW